MVPDMGNVPVDLHLLEARFNLCHGQIDKTLKFLSVESPSPVAQTPPWP
jgi:hypothetical protein